MHNNSFFKTLLFFVSVVLFVSCDKEYSAVGDALIGENNFDLVKYNSAVAAHNEKITAIQSNGLQVNALGIYDNPAFGKTTANFATQLTLASVNPTIGLNPVIDSVMIDVPYFSTVLSTDVSGNRTYELDSIYGASLAKIKLSVYESGRYMGTQSGTPQTFYTNQNTEFDNLKIGNRLNDDANTAQNDAFFFNPRENRFKSTTSAGTEVITRTAPSMRMRLNTAFFKDKIINAPAGSLTTNDVFINYFKGLYFKVEQSGADKGSLAMINFAKGTITVKYKEETSATDKTLIDKSIVLNLSGSTASLLEQSNTNADYGTATANPNRVLGDEKLYVKGGEGSLAVIDLFEKKDLIGYDKNGNLTGPNGVSDELDNIRKEGWLINEASLVFNIDATAMKDSFEPQRIYLYDYTNSRPIIDYFLDGTTATKPKKSRLVFDGNLNYSSDTKRGSNYKVRITNHIRNLVKYADSTNIKLGVAVTESIDIANSYSLKTPSIWIAQAPKSSVMNPLGTILYGGRSSSNPTDKNLLKLEIYYTKPK
ncbi:DUF4270 domain-containing protein [Flavobacterium nackdongense]|uniref:DUF4270 domain-containing protein n=1 Tax=Flavobacterium nackdongense TaxID=2547394 RepID=A0A4P6Y8L7_9FLAO|nr:DUF4270 domain-containing protein [Flavobacterium nackdongense]QBN19156.1 DUF4270 domain-containing protein [Flavobacterium nackdongense]